MDVGRRDKIILIIMPADTPWYQACAQHFPLTSAFMKAYKEDGTLVSILQTRMQSGRAAGNVPRVTEPRSCAHPGGLIQSHGAKCHLRARDSQMCVSRLIFLLNWTPLRG